MFQEESGFSQGQQTNKLKVNKDSRVYRINRESTELCGDAKRGKARRGEGFAVWEAAIVDRDVKNWFIHCLAVLNVSPRKSVSVDEN